MKQRPPACISIWRWCWPGAWAGPVSEGVRGYVRILFHSFFYLQGVFATLTPREFANEVQSSRMYACVCIALSPFYCRRDRKGITVASCCGTRSASGLDQLACLPATQPVRRTLVVCLFECRRHTPQASIVSIRVGVLPSMYIRVLQSILANIFFLYTKSIENSF